jgi:FAD/FMN-containing dehydrogenase
MSIRQIRATSPGPVPAALRDLIVRPGDDGWDEARQAWNLAADQQPAAVARPGTADDVIAIVDWARAGGLRVAAQGTGHSAASPGPLGNAVLVRTGRLRGVQIDPELRRARVGAGAVWGEVSTAAAEFGLAALAGSAPDVGVTGYTLGGGVSWLARRYGLAASSVLAAELVTADGRLVRADHRHEPGLFWALRGGGGTFGVVTAIEFELYPVAEVYAGALFWPAEQAGTVLNAWRTWAGTSPADLTSCGRILSLPPLPSVPEPLRGRSFAVVEVAYLGSAADAASHLEPLRALEPEIDTVATIPAAQLGGLHMDPDGPVPGAGNGMLLDDLPPAAVTALLAVAGPGTDSPLLSVEFRHFGAALGEAPAQAGALASIDAAFGMYAVGMAVTPELKQAINDRIDRLSEALSPWRSHHGYFNFDDRRGDAEGLFPHATYRRLRSIKAAYDPGDLFVSNHPVIPGADGR